MIQMEGQLFRLYLNTVKKQVGMLLTIFVNQVSPLLHILQDFFMMQVNIRIAISSI